MPAFYSDIPCPRCGYNLRGLPLEGRCPECGSKILSPDALSTDRGRAASIDAEVEEILQKHEMEQETQRRLRALLSAWESRGQRLDRLMDRLEAHLHPKTPHSK